MDLVLEFADGSSWAIEIKRSLAAKVNRGFYAACEDINPQRRIVIHGGQGCEPLAPGVEACGLADLCRQLKQLN